MKKVNGSYVLFDDNLIHDQEVKAQVFYYLLAQYQSVFTEIKNIEEDGYTFRAGKMVQGKDLEKLLHDLNVELKALEKPFEYAEKYRLKD